MKSKCFHYSLLPISIAAFMSLNTANAATATAVSAPAAAINNKASASYSIGTVAQPVVESNTVTVSVTETANFSLVSLVIDNDNDPDTAINQTAIPGGTTTFTHALTNTGNVTDTYTVNTTSLNDPTITTATPDYALGTSNAITYTIVQNDGTALTAAQVTALPAGQNQTGTLSNGGTIKLPPTYRANLSYAAATPSTRNGNDKGVGTLTATSSFFTNSNAAKPALVNENQTLVRLPTFKIEKTATCGSSVPCTTLDLTASAPTIDYSIKVTNATTTYSADATSFVIRDVLPVGMTLSGTVTANGASVTSSGRTSDDRQIIDVSVTSLTVGANQVVSFKVNVDKTKYTTANSSATNNVIIYDKFVGAVGPLPTNPTVTTDYDILDSTVTTNDVTRIPSTADAANGAGEDTTSTINFTNRIIVLNNPTIREIAPTSGANQVTHQTNIVNNGQDIEGTNTNPLTFTITDGGNNAAVAPNSTVTITYAPPGGTVGTPITLAATNGIYTINSTTLPSGIAKGGTVAINYGMTSTNAIIGSSETSIVTLTAGGNGAPTVPSVTDTTNVRGLTLLKQLALQVDCTGTISAYEGTLGSNSTATFNSKPGDCIYYKITATNTFTSTSLSNVVVSDSTSQWKDSTGRVQAVYQDNAIGSTGASNTGLIGTGDAQKVSTTFATLASGASGTLIFSTKVSSQLVNVQPILKRLTNDALV